MKILNIGSLNYDYVYAVNHIVKEGETISSYSRQQFYGGKGFNQSVAMKKAGGDIYHCGLLGEDGDSFLSEFDRYGLNKEYVTKVKGISGHAVIQVDIEGQNSILLFSGTNKNLKEDYIEKVLCAFGCGDILVLQNEVNLLPYIIDEAYKRKLHIVLNPSPFNENLENCDLKKISMFMVNEIEAEQLASSKNNVKELLMKKYPNSSFVMTLGAEGAVYFDRNKEYFQKAEKVQVVDTTAAGDTFTGFFLVALSKGYLEKEALFIASKASSITVSNNGAAISIPYWNQIVEVSSVKNNFV